MAIKTMEQLIQDVLERLSYAQGISAQTYAEDRIMSMLQEKFDMLFDHLWWPQFRFDATYTLNGTTGLVTADVSSTIKRYVDILHVWYDRDDHPLPEMPLNLNPANARQRMVTATSNATKVFKIVPVTTTGTVYVRGSTLPYAADSGFELDDEVDLDDVLLVNAVCYDFLRDDASNVIAEEKFKQNFKDRLKQWEEMLMQRSRPLVAGGRANYPTQWSA